VGIARVAVSKLATPAQVRFTISPQGGAPAASLTAPFDAKATLTAEGKEGGVMLLAPASLRQCQFVFDPSKLAAGSYEAKVELLDAAGKPIASQAASLERRAD
jgi:expansin (peptidoglycan-binding protein)